jgi:hypothetical protein
MRPNLMNDRSPGWQVNRVDAGHAALSRMCRTAKNATPSAPDAKTAGSLMTTKTSTSAKVTSLSGWLVTNCHQRKKSAAQPACMPASQRAVAADLHAM